MLLKGRLGKTRTADTVWDGSCLCIGIVKVAPALIRQSDISVPVRFAPGTRTCSLLINMKNFYKSYPDGQTVSDHISWSHYCELLGVSDIDARNYTYYIPDKEQLIRQVEAVLEQDAQESDENLISVFLESTLYFSVLTYA